ncbi:hypothetical protein DCAR_0415777 [Daucus carota subsp. sativus]|uniref:CASP-like protein n=1 Tax=Daucus carota subsp. sativus TaxID=79200 RepID=A0A165WRD9_DAUCS|nr:PREDICTED: CASP-like protein 4A1 [Daucus carota subsp. sativus]WOG96442.1 hypothetical protein DCAR_0415777 [Daucus carota subsp. sativus]
MEKSEAAEKQWRVSDITNPSPNTSLNLPPARSPTDSSLSSCRSSLDHADASQHLSLQPSPSPPLQFHNSPPTFSPTFSAAPNRSVPADPVTVTKPQRAAKETSGGVSSIGTRRMKTTSSFGSRRTVSELVVKKAALGFRFFGFVFCLVSFSVMAADRNKGWAVDSFNRYIEFRYCIAVNAIGVFYSALQGLNLAYQLSSGKLVSGSHLRYIFDFAFDQILAYLLISSSSSAAIRVDDWQSNWGEDKFTNMARASVVVSFIAFVSLAANSMISGYTLCTL